MDNLKNKKIIGIINSLHRGGAERKMVYLLHNEIVSDLFILENKIEYEIREDKIKSIKPLFLNNKIKHPLLKYFIIPFYSFKISRQIERGSTVVSFIERADITNVFSKIFRNHKIITSVLINPKKAYKGLRSPLLLILKISYIFSDKIIVNSKGGAKLLRSFAFLKNKVHTVYNPIEVDFVRQKSVETLSKIEEKIFKNYPAFINVSRLVGAKGQWHLIKIFKKIKESIPEAKLVIVGDGKLRDYLIKLSRELGMKTYSKFENDDLNEYYDIYFFGSQENPFKYISNSSVFISTSLYEGFSNIILEALACGVPIVSSDCRFGPREILAPDTDFDYETKVSEYSSFGIMMPMLDDKIKVNINSFSNIEILWSQTIVDLYKNEKIRDEYSEKSVKRARDFDIKIIGSEWVKSLND
ncbi:MAG: glycosyltransferase [Candidatus Nomurabacteria bacterium]